MPRRNGIKDDAVDAVRAARDALSRDHHSHARGNGARSALAALLVVRRSAVDAATDAQRQLHALIVTAPEPVQAPFRPLSNSQRVLRAAHLRVRGTDIETKTVHTALRALGQRILALRAEAHRHEQDITTIVRDWRPDLLAQHGVGPITAATILCAWSHAGRVRSEAAFAMLAGVAPIPASSGQTIRHRLNRHGDRQLNRAIHVIALTRLRTDPTTRAYAQRRRTDGKTDREIRRCLKRYIARDLYRQLERTP
jgi:transposase